MKNNNSISISIFSICIIIGIIIFGVIYFEQSKYRNNELNNAIDRFNNIIDKVMVNNTNNTLKNELEILLYNNYKLLEDSISNIVKVNMDNITFWFAFLSIIMVVFSILGIVINNGYLSMSKELLLKIEEEAKVSIENIKNKSINEISIASYYYEGLKYKYEGDYQAAIDNFTHCINIDNSSFILYNERGRTYLDMLIKIDDSNIKSKYINMAISDFTKAIELNKEFLLAYLNRGIAYNIYNEDNEDYLNRALSDFEKVIDMNPNIFEVYSNRASVYVKKKEYDKALTDLKYSIKLVDRFGNSYAIYVNIGNTYLAKAADSNDAEDYNDAILNFKEAEKVFFSTDNDLYMQPHLQMYLWFDIGLAYYKKATIINDNEDFSFSLEYFNKAYDLLKNSSDKLDSILDMDKKQITGARELIIKLANDKNETAINYCQDNRINI